MSKAPDWALEGASELQAHRINRDWPEFQRKARAKPQSELKRLWIAAADAAEAFSAQACDKSLTDAQFCRLQEAEYDTANALRDHLLNEHGLTSADLRRSVL